MIEAMVPIQAAGIMSVLFYVSDVKSNSMIYGRTVNEYTQSLWYLGIDLCVDIPSLESHFRAPLSTPSSVLSGFCEGF